MADLPKKIVRTGYSHIAFSVGSIEIVDTLTAELKADGYEVIHIGFRIPYIQMFFLDYFRGQISLLMMNTTRK